MIIAQFKSKLLNLTIVAGFLAFPKVVSSSSQNEHENRIEQLRGTLLWEENHHRELRDSRGSTTSFILGTCLGATTYSGIPFSASAYDNCTFLQDSSVGNLGRCGDPTLALDGDPNHDVVCDARAALGGDCHVSYTQPGELLKYSFYVNEHDHSDSAVFNIILRMAAKKRRTVQVSIDNGGNPVKQDLVVQGTGSSNFQDVIWERVDFPRRGLELISVEFIDGQTNFCNIRVEETTMDSNKTLVIPFNASAQKYTSFYERSQQRYGTCGSGPVDSEPTTDQTCMDRGSNCTISSTESGEYVIYSVYNPNTVARKYNVTLRLASSSNKHRRVMLQVEGSKKTYKVQSSGRGMQVFDDATVPRVTFPPGPGRLYVKFLDKQVNMCSISIQ